MQFSQIDRAYDDLTSEKFQATPYFKHLSVEDIPASEREGKLVMRTIEVCEIRLAGDNKFVSVVPVDAIAFKDGHRSVTYAERFADQYRQFLAGSAQETSGTALEELTVYGVSAAQLSLCRALKIYSVEALYGLEGPNLKALGVHANDLKAMAQRFMADRSSGGAAQQQIEELQRQLAALQERFGASRVEDAAVIEAVADEAAIEHDLASMTDLDLKEAIKLKTGATPRGNPSRETLLSMLAEA